MIERLKAEGVIDVFQTVQAMRLQRPAMVQTAVRNENVKLLKWRASERTNKRRHKWTKERTCERTEERTHEQTKIQTKERAYVRTNERRQDVWNIYFPCSLSLSLFFFPLGTIWILLHNATRVLGFVWFICKLPVRGWRISIKLLNYLKVFLLTVRVIDLSNGSLERLADRKTDSLGEKITKGYEKLLRCLKLDANWAIKSIPCLIYNYFNIKTIFF